MTPVLACRDVSVDYGSVRALSGVDLEVAEGETLALLGPSGAGKTTLAHAIAGFVPLASGEIWLAGELVADAASGSPPDKRRIGVVFQNYALWPHMDAVDIVAYPLRRAGAPKDEARLEAAELMARLGIGELVGRRPAELSGGQQQRVGLARALARRAVLYLLDEPTAHLDATVRSVVQGEIASARRHATAAAIYSTHDAAEALAIADRVALLRNGELIQLGTPQEVYQEPVDRWAAELTGPVSVLEGQVEGSHVVVADVALPLSGPVVPGRTEVLVRPDWVAPGGPVSGIVERALFRGPHTDYMVHTSAGSFVSRVSGAPSIQPGTTCGWTIERAWVPPSRGPVRAERQSVGP